MRWREWWPELTLLIVGISLGLIYIGLVVWLMITYPYQG